MSIIPQSVEYLEPSDLELYDKKLRKPNRAQRRKLAAAIKQFGFIGAIIVNADHRIVAGHARWLAAKDLGLKKIPTIRVDHLSPAKIKAYRIADNKLAEGAKWDNDVLRVELSEIMLELPDLTVDAIGFELPEFELLMDGDKKAASLDSDLKVSTSEDIVTETGMVWQLGNHKIICGDARNAGCFIAIMGDDKACVIFCDLPYNVPINGFAVGKGAISHPNFVCAAGEMGPQEFTEFLKLILQNLALYSANGSVHFLCMDWRHIREIMTAGDAVYDQLLNLIVWNKSNGGMGSLWRSKHELILAFKKGKAKHINNVQLGKFGRNRTNVWDYAGVNSINSEHREDLALHPTVKPTALIADALRDCSNKGDIVLDACGGSGSTLLAAEQTGRRARLIEIDPRYVDVTIRRWQEMTGKQAVNPATGWTFDQHTEITECKRRLEHANAA